MAANIFYRDVHQAWFIFVNLVEVSYQSLVSEILRVKTTRLSFNI